MSLDKKLAYVKYDPLLLSSETVRDAIDDMGFDASLEPPAEQLPEPQEDSSIQRHSVVVHVSGMTCQSCVQTIESSMKQRPEILAISVSLAQQMARVDYDSKLATAKQICEAIDAMGFEARLDDVLVDEFDPLSLQTVRIRVEGMTCQSCVRTIQDKLNAKPGVHDVNVVLEQKQAIIKYNRNRINSVTLCDHIDELGFETSVDDDFEKLARRNNTPAVTAVPSVASCVLHVGGMTCKSCVQSIEGHIGQQTGIGSICVSLADNSAKVAYDPDRLNPCQIAEMIDDMGFECSSDETSATTPDTVTKSAVINVDGMHCKSCSMKIEGELGEMPGVVSISVSVIKKKADVCYQPSVITVAAVVRAIEGCGFTASLHGKKMECEVNS